MDVERIDHLVLTVHDIKRTCEFYSQVLGMKIATFGEGRKALLFGEQQIKLHLVGNEFEPKALYSTPGSADICFITSLPMQQVVVHVRSVGFDIVGGPMRKTGAKGPIESVYLRDPDGNLIEISNYLKAVL